MFLLGKCHLDIGHHGSRSPSRSKFNHIASPGPVLTLISPWLVQEYDLPCFSPGTLLPAPDSDPDVPSAGSIHTFTNSKVQQLCRSTIDLYDMWVCRSVLHRGGRYEICPYHHMVRSVGWAVTWCRPVPPVGLPQIMTEWPEWFKQPSHLNYLLRV